MEIYSGYLSLSELFLVDLYPLGPSKLLQMSRFNIFMANSLLCVCIHSTYSTVHAAAKSLQSCLTLCDPIDGSPLGSSVPGILQAKILEWIAISFSNA